MSQLIPNALAERYASNEMKSIWSASGKVVLEREFWIAVMKAQKELGVSIEKGAIENSEKIKMLVDLEAIRKREETSKHDVKARLEEFAEQAGHQHAHKGMTSRDLTENVEQLQVHRSMGIILEKSIAALLALAKKAREYKSLPLTARSHNVPAQLTTLGKRFANWGEEFDRSIESLSSLCATFPYRGLKGAVGTRLDQITLLGSPAKAAKLDQKVMEYLGAPSSWENVGQVYPRSLDFEVVSLLVRLAASPSSFAKTLRIMAGHELLGEGFAKGQTGSSAMPHKMNSRSCERINGFHVILNGYLTMVSQLSGDQWNEGDVSCSVVRRVALPDAFFALDGLLDTFLTVLNQMEVFPSMIETETKKYLPFLLSTTMMMEAVKAGAGREDAHAAIKQHAVATVSDLRNGKIKENDFPSRLAKDKRVGLKAKSIQALIKDGEGKVGAAHSQVDSFVKKARSWAKKYPEAKDYNPPTIL
ncbi:MAG: adenylosuccinate lyase [Opitutae bacterium]|nr:adenylosuccinate lyase [Opitutae bacterium]|tara:strand:+ start:4559 stop:5983 length:1425 start_codon:yes stop_codon:yes gene_type:complete